MLPSIEGGKKNLNSLSSFLNQIFNNDLLAIANEF